MLYTYNVVYLFLFWGKLYTRIIQLSYLNTHKCAFINILQTQHLQASIIPVHAQWAVSMTWRNTENQQVSTHQSPAPADTRSSQQTSGLIEIDYTIIKATHKHHHPSPVIQKWPPSRYPVKKMCLSMLETFQWVVNGDSRSSLLLATKTYLCKYISNKTIFRIVVALFCLSIYHHGFTVQYSKSPWLTKGTFVFILPAFGR